MQINVISDLSSCVWKSMCKSVVWLHMCLQASVLSTDEVLIPLWFHPCGLIDSIHSDIRHTQTPRDDSEHLEVIPKVTVQHVTQNHITEHSQTLRVWSDWRKVQLLQNVVASHALVWLHLRVYLCLHINMIC